MPEWRLVLVEWHDASGRSGWSREQVSNKSSSVVTAGWLIAEDNWALTVSNSVTVDEDEPQRDYDITIPRGAIWRIRDLKPEA